MSPIAAGQGDAGDWKGGHMRINSSEARVSNSNCSKADEAELQDRSRVAAAATANDDTTSAANNGKRANKGGRGRLQFPRFGLDALIHESRPEGDPNEDGTFHFYKVYKRRWFGLAQLTLLNIIISWEWLTFSPVAAIAADFFNTNESAVNWMSTAFLFAFVAMVPVVIYVLHFGPKPSFVTASVLTIVGSWIRYGGALASPHNFGVVMFGQILIGFAQPFVLAAPTRYSDLWFTNRGRVAATALTSLANPFGAAVGQLVIPFWVSKPSDIPNMVLYLAVIATIICIPSFFVPAKPPTPPSASGETQKLSLRDSARGLHSSPEFWLLITPFVVYVGLFNSISTVISQVMIPYGFSTDEAGIAGAVLIVVGLVAAAVTSPVLDRTKQFLPAIKLAVPLVGAAYLAFVWMPATRGVAGPYAVLAILGAASFALVPVATEYLVELMHPVSPEVTSTLAWSGGQLLGAVFIIVSDALKAGPGASPPENMDRALVFQAVIALAVVPLPLALGLFGRRDKVLLKRVESDDRNGHVVQTRGEGLGPVEVNGEESAIPV